VKVGHGKAHPVGQFVERMQEILVTLTAEAEQAAQRFEPDEVYPQVFQQGLPRLVETAHGGGENGIGDGIVVEFQGLEPLGIEPGVDGHAGPYPRAVGVPQETLDGTVDKTVHGHSFTLKGYAKGR
jgi:class 3 adenylate cyclase